MSCCEDEIIEWFIRRQGGRSGDLPIGIGDDMAYIRTGEKTGVLVTTDILLEGVHFERRCATLEQIGYKAMAVGLSDCAAMATVPIAAVVAVALSGDSPQEDLKRLHAGITSAADRFNCPLVGGDITTWRTDGPLVVTVAMLSRPGGTEPITRGGARVGDAICVTGSLGGAAAGKHLDFEPRLREAVTLAQMVKLTAMIDISDGLSTDINRICRRSKVGAVIDAASIPLSDEARACDDPLDAALNDGEDFELLFTVSEDDFRRLAETWPLPLPITRIGTVTDTGRVEIRTEDGSCRVLQPKGYDHFKR